MSILINVRPLWKAFCPTVALLQEWRKNQILNFCRFCAILGTKRFPESIEDFWCVAKSNVICQKRTIPVYVKTGFFAGTPVIYRNFSKFSKQDVICYSRAIFWYQNHPCIWKHLFIISIWIWVFLEMMSLRNGRAKGFSEWSSMTEDIGLTTENCEIFF